MRLLPLLVLLTACSSAPVSETASMDLCEVDGVADPEVHYWCRCGKINVRDCGGEPERCCDD